MMVICSKCNKPFDWPKGQNICNCPNCGAKLNLNEVRMITQKEGDFFK